MKINRQYSRETDEDCNLFCVCLTNMHADGSIICARFIHIYSTFLRNSGIFFYFFFSSSLLSSATNEFDCNSSRIVGVCDYAMLCYCLARVQYILICFLFLNEE